MANAIAAKDWSTTPIGVTTSWSPTLRTAVNLCLDCSLPAALAWGPERVLIYNDAYRRYCGAKHPAILGGDFAECWKEIWPEISEAFAGAAAGRAARLADLLVFLGGRDGLEESYLTFSLSPVRDEAGHVVGVLHVIEDDTARVLGERRAACLGGLAAATAQAATLSSVCAVAERQLAACARDLPFVLLYLLDDESSHAQLVCRVGLAPDSPACPAVIELSARESWPLVEVVSAGAEFEVDALPARIGHLDAPPYPEPPSRALLLPITAGWTARVIAVLVVGLSPRLPVDEAYRAFCTRLAMTLSGLLSVARAGEEERRQAEEQRTVLMAELDHRVRNILASVQAMVTQTGRNRANRDEYAAVLQGRIAAMARAHGLLTRRQWKGADVAEILQDELAGHGAAVQLSGEAGCIIAPRDAINLALAVHELATNAVSYGSLSVPEGRIGVTWGISVPAGEPPAVRLVWQESGGPPVKPAQRRGFGSQLIQRTLRYVDLVFDEAGVRCTIDIALKQREIPGGGGKPGTGTRMGPRMGGRSREPLPEKPLRGERILVVEDEPAAALDLRLMLEQAGAEVAGMAATLPEAVRLAGRDLSAAVLDINMQGDMGFSVAERLLQRGLRVLMLTRYEGMTVPPHLGGLPLLHKPVDAAALVEQLVAFQSTGR